MGGSGTTSPRRYRMDRRQRAVDDTRRRIVTAAMELHAVRGVQHTGWDDIADAAGVSTATVYRHFPSVDELVPPCARAVFDVIRPPSTEEAEARFATMPTIAARLEHLVRESCHCYARGEAWLHAAHRERDFVPALDTALGVIQGTLHVLVDAAVGRPLPPAEHGTLFTLCDFPFWKALVDRGLRYPAAERTLIDLVRAEAVRLGLSSPEKR